MHAYSICSTFTRAQLGRTRFTMLGAALRMQGVEVPKEVCPSICVRKGPIFPLPTLFHTCARQKIQGTFSLPSTDHSKSGRCPLSTHYTKTLKHLFSRVHGPKFHPWHWMVYQAQPYVAMDCSKYCQETWINLGSTKPESTVCCCPHNWIAGPVGQ